MLTKLEKQTLRKARKLIEEGVEHYICFALSILIARDANNEKQREAIKVLKAYISTQLGDNAAYLEEWQRANGFGDRTNAQTKQDRLDWIDWMLGKK